MITVANGIVRHCFFGTYVAIVTLKFDSEAYASHALKRIGGEWKREGFVLVLRVEADALDQEKVRLKTLGTISIEKCDWKHCARHCADEEIDGIPHSIDLGPPFTFTISIADERQHALL